ncbi:MAG: AMP-binding protein [Actinomycetota bacterium]|nr:AMP-binding protein [Actinomycetota bacterium]
MLVDAWLPSAAHRHPARRAVNALTYADLLVRADVMARRLAGRGVGPGDRVAIVLAPGDAFCIALHAAFRLGAVAVPVDVRLGAAERSEITRGAKELIDGPVIAAEDHDVELAEQHDLDATAVIVHTSGTSGRPRAIELTYGNWLWSALGSAVALGLDPEERWLCTLPLAHVGGLSIVIRSAIYATTAIVHERFDADHARDVLMDPEGPTVVSVVPTILQRLLDAGLRRPPRLRWALLGGAPITNALQGRAAAARVPVAPTYGMTEACSQVTTNGAPLFCTRVRLAEDGEIMVSGPTVSPGVGGELATGDLGEFMADGALRIEGRKADTIVSGGENVAPAEVEAVLEGHPMVVEAGVHAVDDPEWGEAIVATVVTRGPVSEDELYDWCADRLARYKVPKAFSFAAFLPRTASGKLLRGSLR